MTADLQLNVSTWNYACVDNSVRLKDAVTKTKENGFGVELWLNWPQEPEVFARDNWKEVKGWLAGVKRLSVHSKCDNKDWASITNEIELSSFLKADLLVVHVLNFGVVETANKLEIDESYFYEVLRFAEDHNVTLALENGYLSSLQRFCALAGPERLKVCLDIGHANTSQAGMETGALEAFIGEFADRIIHLHFHDNHGKIDEHLVPGEGSIDWRRVLRLLSDAGIPLAGALELRSNIRDAEEAYFKAKTFLEDALEK
jgi:sugar phosphate isomerase/epimerase